MLQKFVGSDPPHPPIAPLGRSGLPSPPSGWAERVNKKVDGAHFDKEKGAGLAISPPLIADQNQFEAR